MRGLRLLGDYILEFFVITLLIGVSAALVVPFVPMLVGVTGFFKTDINTRRFKDIFTTIGKNIKVIIPYTLFELVIIAFAALNLYFFNTHPEQTNYFVLAVSVIAFVVGIVYLVTAPTVIVNMQVKFMQLLYNGIMLLFGGFLRTVASLVLAGGVVAVIMYYPYVLILLPYPVTLAVSKFLSENFLHLKAKILKTSVHELKRNADKDDFLNIDGEVR